MVQDMPPAPPEADVIRLARMAARLGPAEAAEAVRAAGGKISDAYWRDIERGHGGRRGKRVPVRASEGLLAQMAHVTGVTPDELAGAGRPDAAAVLTEILRRERPAAPPGRPRSSSPAADFARSMGIDPDDPDDPYLRPVREAIAAAVLAFGAGATGAQVFRGQSWSHIEAAVWDDPGLSQETKELAIAALRADRTRYESGRGGRRSNSAGLALAAVRGP